MSKTYKKEKGYGLGKRVKLAMRTKRKKYKLAEFPDGGLLNKHLANRWDWD